MNNTDETPTKRFGTPGPKMLQHRVLVVLAAVIVAVSAIFAGCGPLESKDKARTPGSESPVAGGTGSTSTVTVKEAQRALEYWTLEYWSPERMANAHPIPLPEPSLNLRAILGELLLPNGSSVPVTGAAPVPPSEHAEEKSACLSRVRQNTPAAEWPSQSSECPSTRPPATTVGKLPGVWVNDPNNSNDDQRTGGCSASTVDTPAKNLVLTAAHCVLNTLNNDPWSERQWLQYAEFVPGYRNGVHPHGEWAVKRVEVPDQWEKSKDIRYDVALVEVYPSDVTEGDRVVDVVGANGIRFNEPAEQDAYNLGYPSNHANGEVLYYCHDRSKWGGVLNPRITWMKCDFSRGASGGPWLMNFNGETGYLFSVHSHRCTALWCGRTAANGSLFDETIKRLYDKIVGTDVSAPGAIAYQGFDGGADSEIYSMNSEGDDNRQHTSNDAVTDIHPAISPNGERIAFARRSDSSGDDFEIYTMNRDGTDLRQVTDNTTDDYQPDYSPDGTRIAYSGKGGNDFEIYTIDANDANGGTPLQVTGNGTDDSSPDYSRDGTRIAYQGYPRGENDLEILTSGVTGGSPRALTKNEVDDRLPTYRPGGFAKIAYSHDDGNDYEIFTMDADGGSARQITYNGTTDLSPTYSPNTTHIAYSHDDGNDYEIYRINLAYGHVRQLTNNNTSESAPSWGLPGKTKVPYVR